MDHNCAYAAKLIKPLGIRLAPSHFNQLRHDQTRQQEAWEFNHINNNIIPAVEHQIRHKIEGNLLRNFAHDKKDVA